MQRTCLKDTSCENLTQLISYGQWRRWGDRWGEITGPQRFPLPSSNATIIYTLMLLSISAAAIQTAHLCSVKGPNYTLEANVCIKIPKANPFKFKYLWERVICTDKHQRWRGCSVLHLL